MSRARWPRHAADCNNCVIGITSVVLQVLFMQQNQRVKNVGSIAFHRRPHTPDLHRLAAARTRVAHRRDDDIPASLPSVAQTVAQIAMMKIRTLARCERSPTKQSGNRIRYLEFGWHVTVGRHVAVDFETDTDFNQNGCRPRHVFLLLDVPEIVPKNPEQQ